MIVIAPFFSSSVIPFRVKAVLSFLITLVIFPIVANKGYSVPGDMGEYFLSVLPINSSRLGLTSCSRTAHQFFR